MPGYKAACRCRLGLRRVRSSVRAGVTYRAPSLLEDRGGCGTATTEVQKVEAVPLGASQLDHLISEPIGVVVSPRAGDWLVAGGIGVAERNVVVGGRRWRQSASFTGICHRGGSNAQDGEHGDNSRAQFWPHRKILHGRRVTGGPHLNTSDDRNERALAAPTAVSVLRPAWSPARRAVSSGYHVLLEMYDLVPKIPARRTTSGTSYRVKTQVTNSCGRGETGRRARFRSWSRKGWRFESSRPHVFPVQER